MPAVSFNNVFFSYDNTPVLRNVTCSINQGDFVGIIGPNGGGKTTFLKLIMGFLKPTAGSISVFDHAPTQESSTIAYVPQTLRHDKLFPISVMELVLMGRLSRLSWWGQYSTADEQAAIKALERVDLLSCSQQAVGNLSGGQLQRALIARALASDPKLLILDEPTASVDTQAEQDIYSLLRTLSHHMTILMVTHDLNVAVECVNKILCIQGNVRPMAPAAVCEHFAMGLYHPPFLTKETSK